MTEQTVQDLDKIKRRIKALLSRADHKNTPAPEAELSRQQAEKLMVKYSITEAKIQSEMGDDYKFKPSKYFIDVPNPFATHKGRIITYLCDVFNSAVFYDDVKGASSLRYHLYGHDSDLDTIFTLFMSLYEQMTQELIQAELDCEYQLSGHVGARFRKSFIHSFGVRIHQRLTEMYREEIAENGDAGTELVLADRKRLSRVAMFEENSNLREGRPSTITVDPNAMDLGKQAGDRADITLSGSKISSPDSLALA